VNRLRLATALTLCGASVALAACGGSGVEGSGETITHPVAEAQGKPSGNLTISNWALYIDKKTIPEFEQATDIHVNYVEDINSYDEFFGKMQPLLARGESGGRSLMVATDWLAKKMYDLGYIQRLDKQALAPAFSHLDPDIKAPSSDPNWTFSLPWQGGMTGLIVNKELAPDVHSVNAIFDPKYKGKIDVVTEMREVVPLVMKGEGIDPATASTQDWLDTIDKLKEAAASGQIRRFTGGDYAKDLVDGNAAIVIGWAADAIQLQADNPDIQWVMPAQGCMQWWDDWVIPVGAPNPTAAYEWINYTYQPKHQAQIDAWTSSVAPVEGVKEIFEKTDPQAAKNPLIFPSAKYTRNCSTPISPPGSAEDQKPVEQAWASLTSG